MDKQECINAISAFGAGGFLERYKQELIEELKSAKRKLVWIHGAGCSGCTMSFLNCDHELLGTMLRNECIIYHKTLLEQSGFFLGGMPVRTPELNIEYYLDDIEKTGGYVLVVEGALVEGPDNSGKYCLIGGETVKERIVKAANKAKVIISLGTCAFFLRRRKALLRRQDVQAHYSEVLRKSLLIRNQGKQLALLQEYADSVQHLMLLQARGRLTSCMA